jgi:lipoprotein-releasing system permease protein
MAGLMFHPLPAFIGLRYARARSSRFFVSFITWVSLLGVMVGVAALIVILSVMNGFETELRSRLLSLSAAIRVSAPQGSAEALRAAEATAVAIPGVTAVKADWSLQALAMRPPEMLPLELRVGDPATDTALREMLLGEANSRGEGLVLGQLVAQQLAVAEGDHVTLLVPRLTTAGVPEGRLREFMVSGVFEAGIRDHDATLAFLPQEILAPLAEGQLQAQSLKIEIANPLQAQAIAASLVAKFRESNITGLAVRDWTEDHASYFRAIRIEKTMMALILLLVVAVAAFNIVAMLVMVVTDKRSDIAILRTLGLSPGGVARSFVTQGLMVGWLGVVAGVLFGVWLAKNVAGLLGFLERRMGLAIFDPDTYYITAVPSELHWQDVVLIAVAALLITALATVYPARRAAQVPPAEALRYE